MIPTYVPVLKALASEFDAVANMAKPNSRKVRPLFEIPRIGKSIIDAKRFKGCTALTAAYLDEVAGRMANVWRGRLVMADAYPWQPDATVETGEHIIPYVYGRLESLGVRVVPVIGYDRWENQTYRMAIQGIEVPDTRLYCLRLDADAIEDAADPEHFLEKIQTILDDLALLPARCFVLFDFGDVTTRSVEEMMLQTSSLLALLEPYGFSYFVTAGCSLHSSINQTVKKQDSTGKVLRKEMLLWQATRQEHEGVRVVYGDYGVRGPASNEGVPNPNTNGKIRYTIGSHFFVARGHSMKLPGKGEQMWRLAETVMQSQHYMGEDFSWGDERVAACSRKEFKGTAGQWITIDTNHHLAYSVAEVENFEMTVMSPAGKATRTA